MTHYLPYLIDLTFFCALLQVHVYFKNQDFRKNKSVFLKQNQEKKEINSEFLE